MSKSRPQLRPTHESHTDGAVRVVRVVPESVSARMQPDLPWRRFGRARHEREVVMSEKLASGSSAGTTLRTGINYWAVAVAAAATLVTSSVWYIVFGNAWLTLRGMDPSTADMSPEVWVIAGQFARNLVVAVVLAFLLRRLGTATWGGALRLGLLVWVGFEAMAIAGSVLHEQYPLGLYAIHVGDALLGTLTMTLILGLWRRGTG
jgi:hypothetical protein